MKNNKVQVTRPGGPEVLQIISEDIPEPKVGEYRVKILVAGVSYADLLMREGVHPETKPSPFTLGWDFVGVIDKPGQGSLFYEKGQMVAGLPIVGAYANYICLSEKELVPVSEDVDPVEAVSLVLNYITGYQMMYRSARVRLGQRVLIHAAAGGVGTAQLQLGQLLGLEMYGTASARNHDIVTSFGGIPIDYQQADFVSEINDLTGNGVDVVFDGIGGTQIWRSYRTLRTGGKVISYGLTDTLDKGQLSHGSRGRTRGLYSIASQVLISHLIPDRKRITIYSIQNLKRLKPTYFRDDLSTLLDLLAHKKIKPIIAARFPLQQASQAHELLAEGVRGKVVLLCDN